MREHPKTIELLRGSPAFSDASEELLEEIVEHLEERPVERGEKVITEGDPGADLFLIAEGECEVSLRGEALQVLGPGEVFGEIASIGGSARTASVSALAEGRLLVLPQAHFLAAVRNHPRLASAILRSMGRYLED